MPRRVQNPKLARRRAELPGREFRRIVSLVPSLSEALVALGLGDRLVGVTVYCVEPPGAFDGIAKVGGTKDADVEAVLELCPDLVIANQEENTARVVERIAAAGVDVWVSYPRTVREGAELLRELATLGGAPDREMRVVTPVFAELERAERLRQAARAAGRRPPRVACLIWRDPWMSVGPDTYIHDLIEQCGGENVFAKLGRSDEPADLDRPGRPGDPAAAEYSSRDGRRSGGERRYPIVELAAIERAAPDVILLPSEPYPFGEMDRSELRGLACPAAVQDRVHLIDGTLVSWYGPRIAEAIRVLGRILAIS
jgi:ABC-type hemin transport system substrate-binding protein